MVFTLRAASDVRAPQFGSAEGDLDIEMVAIAGAIISQRTGHFDPSTYRDRYQEALQQLIEAKTKGLTIKPRASTPSPVIDLMAALKRSLVQEPSAPEQETAKRRRTKQASDRHQPALLLPLTGDRKRNRPPSADWAVSRIMKPIGRGTGQLTRTVLPQANAYAMIRRRAATAGIATKLGNHSFRATGITAYLKNGGTLEKAAAMANTPRRARRSSTIAGATSSASMRSSGL
jgi:hypothetical protein